MALDVGLVLAGPSLSASGSTWASCSSASGIEAARGERRAASVEISPEVSRP
ncbi:hypothetical protein [Polyangium jinanense]|uniref:Uncharacterized protein n=1 Tax=Polyangium jinanense TaxID=2829994 RepID=A0A9X3XFE0_9BACT|nr:hypothetical protein [Polyangium jinanense]MDC3988390.1 hypothetical protein [Polyangium jinanense]